MNVSQHNVDELNSIITIEVKKDDYYDKVEKKLKQQSKKAKMPGFRPGMVPVNVIKKLYGRNIVQEEVGSLLSSTLNKYIEDNQLQILGQPLSSSIEQSAPDLDGDEYSFSYELGLAPKFDLSISPLDRLTEYSIFPDEDTLRSRMKNLRRAYGKMSAPELSEASDVLFADFIQLSTQGSVVPNGIVATSSLKIETVTDPDQQAALTGLKNGDVLTVDLNVVFSGNERLISALLKTGNEQLDLSNLTFRMTVKNVNRLGEADLNEEFFSKVYPGDTIKNEDELLIRIGREIRELTLQNAREKLDRDIIALVVAKFNAELPDGFLKRWLLVANEARFTAEEIENQYAEFQRNLKWTLIESKILKENGIEVQTEEMIALAKEKLSLQSRLQYSMSLPEEQITEYALKMLQDREQASKLFEELRARKTLDHLRSMITLEKEEIAYDEFMKLSQL